MTQRFAEGKNYEIDVTGSLATCRVWSRPDLDSTEGAQLAAEKIAVFQRLSTSTVHGLLLDLSRAPPVTGAKTQESLGAMLKAWQDAAKYVAVVAASNSMQQLQLRRIITTFAPDYGKLFDVARQAEEWLTTIRRSKPAAPRPK
jgi:hypothetical protein